MAGILALIGGAFGIGCGANGDLTYDGAERWEANIPMDYETEVYFYTTQVSRVSYSLYIMTIHNKLYTLTITKLEIVTWQK